MHEARSDLGVECLGTGSWLKPGIEERVDRVASRKPRTIGYGHRGRRWFGGRFRGRLRRRLGVGSGVRAWRAAPSDTK